MNKMFYFILLLVVLSLSVFADEAQDIYTSEELLLTQTITGSFTIAQEDVRNVQKVNANLVLFPKNTLRQSIISETVTPQPSYRDEHAILFQFSNPSSREKFEVVSTVRTRNSYVPVQSKITYPYSTSDIPDDVRIYLEETSYIDITPQIREQAQKLATSDDLFDVAFTIASWVRNNIEYNLSTITADASQSASWVFEQRRGVCDELSTLYISMMRSIGVPARFVSGISYTNSPLFDDKWNNHAWVEVYMGKYGWIPFDLTYGQFGYIDASHIAFQKTVDSRPSKTVYTWDSRGSESVDVEFSQLSFETSIDEKRSRIVDFFSVNITPVYEETGFDSWNALLVTASNNYNHYVTANMVVSSSKEIEYLENTYSFYLKPFETRTIIVPFYIPDLDERFEYTFPFTLQNYYSQIGDSSVKSAQRFASYTQDQMEKKVILLQTEIESQPLTGVTAYCESQELLFVNETAFFDCEVNSVKEQEGVFCFESNCSSFKVSENTSQSFTYPIVVDSFGEYIFELQLTAQDQTDTVLLPQMVIDRSSLYITNDSGALTGEYGDTYPVWFVVKKESHSPAKDVVVQIGDVFPYVWNMGTLYVDQNISVLVESTHLQPGVNKYPIKVWYKDEEANQYEIESSVTLELQNITFWQRIKLFFSQLLL